MIDPRTLTVECFNTSLSSMDRTTWQKMNREILELVDSINQMDLIHSYRIFHPNTKYYAFFFAPRESLSKTDWNHRHQAILHIQENWYSSLHPIRPPLIKLNNKNNRNLTNSQKQLHTEWKKWVKQETKRDIKSF